MLINYINVGVTSLAFLVLYWVIKGLKETVSAQAKTISTFQAHIDLFDQIAKRYKQYVDDFHEDLRKRDAEIEDLTKAVSLGEALRKQDSSGSQRSTTEIEGLRVLMHMLGVLMKLREQAIQISSIR